MLHAIVHEFVNIVTWPMSTGKHGGYNFASGNWSPNPWEIGAGALLYWKHNNCHVKGCPFTGHKHPDHGWPSCRLHYDHELQGLGGQ